MQLRNFKLFSPRLCLRHVSFRIFPENLIFLIPSEPPERRWYSLRAVSARSIVPREQFPHASCSSLPIRRTKDEKERTSRAES